MITTNDNKEVFETMAGKYIREDSHWGCDIDLMKSSTDELLKNKSIVRWLDIGCGTGYHITSIGEIYPEIEITGLDYSNAMLKEAQLRIDKLGLKNIVLKEADIIDAEFSEKYDIITFLNNGLGNIYRDGGEAVPEEIRKTAVNKVAGLLQDNEFFILSVYNKEKIDLNKYGGNLTIVPDASNLEKGDLFVEYSLENGKVHYYSHWFSEEELYELTGKTHLKIDFLEPRMSRFLVRYKKEAGK